MSELRVSIIIPCFNAEKTLENTLRSVFSQSYPHIDVLVIDGGSNAATLRIIDDFKNQLFYAVSEKDKGIYDAINKGISKARGQYILVLGADDVLADAKVIEKLLPNDRSVPQLIFGNVENRDVSNAWVPQKHVSSFTSTLYWKNTLHQQSALYHKSLFLNFRFQTEYSVLADYDFHLRLYKQNISTLYRPITVAICSATGLSKQFGANLYKQEWNIKKRLLPLWALAINAIVIPLKWALKRLG
jgi:putative colanic acid biosynthesis glycosyltransferase